MRKTILVLTLLFSAMNMMAQSYPFKTERNEIGTKFTMNDYVYTGGRIWDEDGIYAKLVLNRSSFEGLGEHLFLYLHGIDFYVTPQIYEKIGEGKSLGIRLVLKNGDTVDYRNRYVGKAEDKPYGLEINLLSDDSQFKKLMNSDIAAIGIYGLSEEPIAMLLESFHSAATLKAMYDTALSAHSDTNVSGVVRNVWIDHNVTDHYGNRGMKIHVKFDIYGMLNKRGQASVYFYYENGNPLRDTNGRYHTTNGNVSTGIDFKPNYENCTYNDLSTFMPYSELHLNQSASCYLFVIIWNGEKYITESEKVYFEINK